MNEAAPATGADRASRSDPMLGHGALGPLHDLARVIGAVLFRVLFRLRVRGSQRLPRQGPVVLVANHSAFVDGPLLFSLTRRRTVFLIKSEMFSGPMGWFLRRIGQIPVRRGEVDRVPLTSALRSLRGGAVVGVFPEGTRREDSARSDAAGELGEAQQGAAWLAGATGATVVPVAVRGTPRTAGRRWRPVVDVRFGAAVPMPSGRGKQVRQQATERVHTAMSQLLAELDAERDDSGHTGASQRDRRNQ